jgi:hypothetical protein
MFIMTMKFRCSLLAFVVTTSVVACNEREDQRQDKQGEDTVNVSDTRRNTDDTVNTIPDTATMKVGHPAPAAPITQAYTYRVLLSRKTGLWPVFLLLGNYLLRGKINPISISSGKLFSSV